LFSCLLERFLALRRVELYRRLASCEEDLNVIQGIGIVA
jgi:hypothetical protein